MFLTLLLITSVIIAAFFIYSQTKFMSRLLSGSYDFWLGQGICSTPFQYRTFLELIPENSTILDVGCGNGTWFIQALASINSKTTKSSKRRTSRFSASTSTETTSMLWNRGNVLTRIEKLGLKGYYECKHQDLFKLQETGLSFGTPFKFYNRRLYLVCGVLPCDSRRDHAFHDSLLDTTHEADRIYHFHA